jgi:hypothetical protein
VKSPELNLEAIFKIHDARVQVTEHIGGPDGSQYVRVSARLLEDCVSIHSRSCAAPSEDPWDESGQRDSLPLCLV